MCCFPYLIHKPRSDNIFTIQKILKSQDSHGPITPAYIYSIRTLIFREGKLLNLKEHKSVSL